MKSNLATLMKLEMTKRFGFNTVSHEKDSKKKYRAIAMIFVMAFVVIVMGGYCFGISYGFGYMGISYVVPGYALTISSLVVLMFTFLKTNGVLFASKDYDMLMALPMKTETVITAKFLSMYLNNLAFTAVVMIPMAVGYGFWNEITVLAVISWTLGIIFAPLLPMTIAAIVGAVIAGIGSGFRNSAFAQLILTVLLIVAIFAGSFWMNDQAAKDEAAFLALLANLGTMISGILHKIYPLSAWFDRAVGHENLLALLGLIAVSVIIYGVFAFVCGKCYRRINSALKSHHAASNYKMGELKSSSLLMALAKKEAKRFFSSSLYMMNIGMGLVLALLLAVVSIFTGIDKIIDGINITGIDAIRPLVAGLMPFGIAMIVNMCNTCAVSLSLEGNNLWIMQSLPITMKTLLKGKMLFNVIMVLPVSLVCSIIFMLELHVNVVMALIYIVFAVVSVLFSTVWGTWSNVKFPNYQWQNEVEVIKQGASSMLGIFGSIVIYLALGAAAFFLSRYVAIELAVLGCCAILGLVGTMLYRGCK